MAVQELYPELLTWNHLSRIIASTFPVTFDPQSAFSPSWSFCPDVLSGGFVPVPVPGTCALTYFVMLLPNMNPISARTLVWLSSVPVGPKVEPGVDLLA